MDEFTIVFECQPYQQQTNYNDNLTWTGADMYWGSTNIPWNGLERIFTVVPGQTITVENAGTYKALPIIVLKGVASTVSFGGFTYANLNGTIYIDCENKHVCEIVNSKKINKIMNFSGEFPELAPGLNQFAITGTITNLIVEFNYKNTYL
jgi:phage-related protein